MTILGGLVWFLNKHRPGGGDFKEGFQKAHEDILDFLVSGMSSVCFNTVDTMRITALNLIGIFTTYQKYCVVSALFYLY